MLRLGKLRLHQQWADQSQLLMATALLQGLQEEARTTAVDQLLTVSFTEVSSVTQAETSTKGQKP